MTIYLIAETGKPKEVLEKWRKDYLECDRKLKAFMTEIGANKAFRFPFEKASVFGFPGNVQQEGWTKPGRNGASSPKKSNKEMIARIEALEWVTPLDQLVPAELGLPTKLRYESEELRGTRYLYDGKVSCYSACWTSNPDKSAHSFILEAPDFAAAEASTDGELTWLPTGTAPVIPEGFRKVSAAEVDLIFAEMKVARERVSEDVEDAPSI